MKLRKSITTNSISMAIVILLGCFIIVATILYLEIRRTRKKVCEHKHTASYTDEEDTRTTTCLDCWEEIESNNNPNK
ncbi:hypothetical protein [Flavobacterium sp.]|uniref:hypothetical protein n=1 Tax=Flavobacterium sp. TaxID=239 RepID=UPI003D6C6D2B